MADWSPTTIAAFAAGAAVVFAAFFAGIVSVITAWRTIASKVSAIEGHVNSEKTASDGKLNTLQRENDLLREIMAEHKQTAALLAQSVATIANTPLKPKKEL